MFGIVSFGNRNKRNCEYVCQVIRCNGLFKIQVHRVGFYCLLNNSPPTTSPISEVGTFGTQLLNLQEVSGSLR